MFIVWVIRKKIFELKSTSFHDQAFPNESWIQTAGTLPMCNEGS